MKREDLKAMNLSDEQVNQIMAWNGQDMQAAKSEAATEKARADGLQEQLNTLTTDLANARNEAVTAKDLKTKLEAAEAKIKASTKHNAIRDALAEFKPKDSAMLLRLLEMDKIEYAEDGTITGLKEQIDPLKANSAYLFADTPDPAGGNPNPGNTGGAFDMNAFLRG